MISEQLPPPIFSKMKLTPPLLAVLTLFVAGCSGSSDKFELGEVKNGKYHNQFFGLAVTLPQDWKIADSDFMQKLNEEGTKRVDLVFSSKDKAGSTVHVNPSIVCSAMKVEQMKSGADYVAAIKHSLQVRSMPFTIVRDVSTKSIAGKPFGVMEIDYPVSGTTAHQLNLIVPLKGYALGFIATYDDDDAATIDEVIQSIKFEN
jgi:hypothetical protein